MPRTARVALLALLLPLRARGQSEPPPQDLTAIELEQLMETRVTSVTKREQTVANAAQAITVITQEEIRRSGVETLADALRLAPGLDVAQISSNQWAVSARGFNGRFANKLLVLIDGRTVYTPLFSGVFWEDQDTLLEDVERIEVIRGPGAAIWGANAVNGVVNVITKRAGQTQGLLAAAGGGSHDRAFGRVRWGGVLSPWTSYRVYLKGFARDAFEDAAGNDAGDRWREARGGFRLDWARGAEAATLSGDLFSGSLDERFALAKLSPPYVESVASSGSVGGGDLLGRFRHAFSPDSDLETQVSWGRTRRNDAVHEEGRDTVELDVSHRLAIGERHEVVWGLGYRATKDDIRGSFTIAFYPSGRRDDLFSGFAQDEITIVPRRLRLTLGTKLEHNDYTGFEAQPDVRLLFTPSASASIWAAVSRAVRTPSRFEQTARIGLAVTPSETLPVATTVFGDPAFRSETVVAYELGTRGRVLPWLSLDAALFYDVYRRLRTFEAGTPELETSPLPPHIVFPLRPANLMYGDARGVEIAATAEAAPGLKISASYTFLHVNLALEPGSADATSSTNTARDAPEHQAQLRVAWDPAPKLKADGALFYLDRVINQSVPSYFRFDARLAYAPSDALELSFSGFDLIGPPHAEVGPSFLVSPSFLTRRVIGKLACKF